MKVRHEISSASEVSPRIALISALAQSPGPAMAAMRELWPEARAYNLIDDSLADDLAAAGSITAAIFERFERLGRYAASAQDHRGPTAGILFTCSAFCPAIERVKQELAIPVLTPNEAAFEDALDIATSAADGGRVGPPRVLSRCPAWMFLSWLSFPWHALHPQ